MGWRPSSASLSFKAEGAQIHLLNPRENRVYTVRLN